MPKPTVHGSILASPIFSPADLDVRAGAHVAGVSTGELGGVDVHVDAETVPITPLASLKRMSVSAPLPSFSLLKLDW